jgi:hypothetical protein
MARSLTATLECGISATLQSGDFVSGNPSKFSLSKPAAIVLANGSGADQANGLYVQELVIDASSFVDLDLMALLGPVSDTLSFAKVRAIQLEADAANSDNIHVDAASGSNVFVGPLAASANAFALTPGARCLWTNRTAGWTVDATHRSFRLVNDAGVSGKVRVVIAGVLDA